MKIVTRVGMVMVFSLLGFVGLTEESDQPSQETPTVEETPQETGSVEKVGEKQREKAKKHKEMHKNHRHQPYEIRLKNLENWRARSLKRCHGNKKCEDRVQRSYEKKKEVLEKHHPQHHN